jgi:hypothetical protein
LTEENLSDDRQPNFGLPKEIFKLLGKSFVMAHANARLNNALPDDSSHAEIQHHALKLHRTDILID